jgi:hypothetical protein
VRCSDVARSENRPLRIEPEGGEVQEDSIEAQLDVPSDVLEEGERSAGLVEDSPDFRPEVSRVVLSESLPSLRKRLAGITGSDKIHSAAPRSAVEGAQVVPYRSRSQGRLLHPCHESGCGSSVPFDETHGANGSPESNSKAELESAVPGT